jgi:hypothetical protein
MESSNLTPLEGIEIRKIWHNEEWHFSVVDVIAILTDSANPQSYWGKLKEREPELSTICGKFKFLAPDRKMRPTDCANTERIIRIIMSIPSQKALAVKKWIAEVVKEKLDGQTIDAVILNCKSENKITVPMKTYLMKDFFRGFHKIGKSINPQVRERTLQSEVPTIELVHVIDEDIEKHLHEKFSAKRIRGEWFNLSNNDLNYITSWKMN